MEQLQDIANNRKHRFPIAENNKHCSHDKASTLFLVGIGYLSSKVTAQLILNRSYWT